MIEVYADLLFILNFFIDYILISGLYSISGRKKNRARHFFSAFVGGCSSLLVFVFQDSLALQFILKIFGCLLIIFIANKFISPKEFAKEMFIYLFLNIASGGIVFLGYSLFKKPNAFVSPIAIYFDISPLFLMSIIFLSYFAIVCYKKIVENKLIKSGDFKVKISLLGKTKELNGFVDTGNLLREPISSYPVIVTELKNLASILPKEFVDAISSEGMPYQNFNNIPDSIRKSFRLIPFSSVGKAGLLPSLRADYVEIENNACFSLISNVYIGISVDSLEIEKDKIILNPLLLKVSNS